MPMNPYGKAGRLLAVLAEGPATTAELAAELDITSHNAGTHLRNLFDRGKVARDPFQTEAKRWGHSRVWLWRLA